MRKSMMTTTTTASRRQAHTVRLPDYMVTDLRNEAQRQGISVNRLIEDSLEQTLYSPNAETLAAIEEARSSVEMEEVDTSSYEAFRKSLGL